MTQSGHGRRLRFLKNRAKDQSDRTALQANYFAFLSKYPRVHWAYVSFRQSPPVGHVVMSQRPCSERWKKDRD